MGLKEALIGLGEAKTHRGMAAYGLLLGEHVLERSGLERSLAVEDCFAVVKRWLRGDVERAREERRLQIGMMEGV